MSLVLNTLHSRCLWDVQVKNWRTVDHMKFCVRVNSQVIAQPMKMDELTQRTDRMTSRENQWRGNPLGTPAFVGGLQEGGSKEGDHENNVKEVKGHPEEGSAA